MSASAWGCGSDGGSSELMNVKPGMDGGGDGDGPHDAGADAAFDPLDVPDGSDTVFVDERCRLGSAQNSATTGTLDVFGHITYFADGADLNAGTYRVVYEDGCMKYSGNQGWTVNAYASPNDDYAWFVGATTGSRLVRAPGTVGHLVTDGAFEDFEACVQANLALKPTAFKHQGGKLGVWLADTAYVDNMVGVDNRNPRWRLERVDCDADAGPR
ncbi:MAG: hypothetical protein QM778_06375 [Myxococcales bacterium]